MGNFTVRLVADQPFAEDTRVPISYEDINATGQCSRLHTIILLWHYYKGLLHNFITLLLNNKNCYCPI